MYEHCFSSAWTLTLTLIGLGCSLLRTSAQPIYTPYAFTNFAGQPGIVGAADGIGNAAGFNLPHGIAADNAGNLYVSDMSSPNASRATESMDHGSASGVRASSALL